MSKTIVANPTKEQQAVLKAKSELLNQADFESYSLMADGMSVVFRFTDNQKVVSWHQL